MEGLSGDDRSKVKPVLLDSIAKFLQSNGFSRTLNKFRSEAHLQEDGGKGPAVDLEEMCLKFLPSLNGSGTSDAVKDDPEKKSKHKKKKASHSTAIQKEDESNVGTRESVLDESGRLVNEDNAGKKSKGKKKKRACHFTDVKVEECKEEGSNSIDNGNSLLDDRGGLAKDDDKNSDKAVVSKENKATKKRKRHGSKDNENEHINGEAIDESVPKCEDASEDFPTEKKKLKASINGEKGGGSDAIMKYGHNEQAQEEAPVHCNGVDKNAVKEGEKSASQTSTKKQHNGSAEPTSAKAFQRVKVEEVVFADDRLKDNSYWAKGGADMGYGAKAQEVLGQVRGRDFRHEKTKKKRGSYRGGQIDLQSHSIKFNYSDDE